MLTVRLPAALAAALALGWLSTAAAQQKSGPTTKPENRDVPRHKQFVEKAKTAGPVDVVFVGDSITQGWEGSGKAAWAAKIAPFKPFNLGIGGDRTQHVLWRLTEGKELEGLSPKAAVVMIGTNNTGGNSAEEIAEGVKAVVEELKKQKPGIKVLLLGVFPRGKAAKEAKVAVAADLNPKIKAVNDIIAKLDDGKTVKYLDIGGKFLDSSGGLSREIMPDLLHLSPKGYEIWADAIEKPLADLLKN